MEFNVHPLLVHFPISFLLGYTFVELARFPFFTRQVYYFYLKSLLLFAGVVAAVPTIIAGLLAQQYVSDKSLADLHEKINLVAVGLFTLLAICYLIVWINHNPPEFLKKMWWWPLKVKVATFVIHTPLVILGALIAAGVLSTGAAIGGILVYGPNLDPFTHFIASMLKVK